MKRNQPRDEENEGCKIEPEEQIRFDRYMREAISSTPIPANLEDSIRQTCEREGSSRLRHVVYWGSMAAILTLFVGISAFIYVSNYNSKISKFSDFRDAMAYYVDGSYFLLDYNINDLGKISTWLDENDAPRFDQLPATLMAKEPIGCKRLQWKDQVVSLVCFHREDNKIVHLFIIDKAPGSSDAFIDIQQVAISHGLQTGGWESNNRVHLLVGSEPDVTVDEYLSGAA
ncbi:hypothetical protein [Rubellicoccus peritrichatus]|uniref:Uncharacterized protein n=1 Tax=Rubellicoccus peritrichatus TaxID=3080537 RepID=A0AAQ3LCU5_9BACT|nr:hypothetical protein [Puniceicoccus sp. CR14]WOO43047.1 hypothetical protein RZN69_08070 [Puniceicoccus sp. CR14]